MKNTDAIQERIAALPSRTEKARAAAAWMFFEQGEYPSAARVRELIGVGSMSDLSRDMRDFWDDVRSRLKTRITSPELPQEVVDYVEQFIDAVWLLAQDKASESLQERRAEIEQQLDAMRQDLLQEQAQAQASRDQAALLQQRVDQMQADAERDAAQIAALQERVTALARAREDDEARHVQALSERDQAVQELHQRMSERETTAQRQVEAAAGEVRFAKMQIENARGEARHWKAEFERERSESTLRISTLEQRMNAAREEAGRWQIKAQEAQERISSQQEQMARLHEQLRSTRFLRKLAAKGKGGR